MVLTIQAEGADSFSFDLSQKDVIFLLNYAQEHGIKEGVQLISEKVDGDGVTATVRNETTVETVIGNETIHQPEKYKGFMLIRCSECGELKGFCAKKPTDTYYCKNCGGKTPLTEMRVLYQDCDCGKHYKYITNCTEDTLSHRCIECGGITEMRMNSRRTAYVTKQPDRTSTNIRTSGFAWSQSGNLFRSGVTA